MNNKVDKTSDFSVMAIFLVDLQISEKTKLVLTRKELVAMIFFLLFALIPREEILRMMVDGVNKTWWEVDIETPQFCNPHTRTCL